MKITIDTDWLRERKYRDAEQEQNYQAKLYKQGYNDALDNAIDKLEEWKPETTDAVEVVRCRDCKHGKMKNYAPPQSPWCCVLSTQWHKGDFFCACGERRQ